MSQRSICTAAALHVHTDGEATLRVSSSAHSGASEVKTISTVSSFRSVFPQLHSNSNYHDLHLPQTQLSVCCCGAELPGPQRDAASCSPLQHRKTLHEGADCWDAACIGVARQHCSECKRVKICWDTQKEDSELQQVPTPTPTSPSDVTPFPVMKVAGVVSVPCFTDIMDTKFCNHVD